jgi:indole-3-glycerol phosphate synthase
MPTKLEEIIAAARRSIAASKAAADLRALREAAEHHQPRGFRAALKEKSAGSAAIIAELKKASPSKGLIRADFPVAELAVELEAAGATALSILTDETYFQGSLSNLQIASSQTALPCLRKDFIVDEFQILEARAFSADAILLIVAVLTQAELSALIARARASGLDVLCEAHDQDELLRAVDAGCDLIGVNNRDLRSFKVDPQTTFRLAELIPKDVIGVAESGIATGADIARLRAAGYSAFLIGESLMKAESPGEALRSLLAGTEADVSRFSLKS